MRTITQISRLCVTIAGSNKILRTHFKNKDILFYRIKILDLRKKFKHKIKFKKMNDSYNYSDSHNTHHQNNRYNKQKTKNAALEEQKIENISFNCIKYTCSYLGFLRLTIIVSIIRIISIFYNS